MTHKIWSVYLKVWAFLTGFVASLWPSKTILRVPLIGGADEDELTKALNHVGAQLKEMNEREAAGEQVDAEEKEKLKQQQKALEEAQGNKGTGPHDGETEIDYLRRFKQETDERTEARSMVEALFTAKMSEEKEKASRLKEYAKEAVAELFGGDVSEVERTIERVMKNTRQPSRFAGQGADAGYVELAARGGATVLDNADTLRAGDDRQLKELERIALPLDKGGDGLGIGQFITLLNKHKYSFMEDHEKRYFDNLRKKALAEGTPSAGGILVPREYMQDLLGLLRAQAVVRRANPRIQRFNREMYQTSVSSGATAFYTQENAQIPVSEETFAEAPLLTPKNLTALVPVSNYLLNDAPAAEDFVRTDLAEVMALREDLAFLRGTGTAGEPTGFRNIAGITLDPIAPTGTGVQLTLMQIRRIRAVFRSLNAGAVRPVWFFNPEFLTYLETMAEMSAGQPTGRTLLDAETLQYDDDTMTTGRFDGIRFFSTTQLPNGTTGGNPTTELYLINMAEAIVGENQELEIDVSREASYWDGAAWVSAYQNNQSVFRAVMRHDVAHRRPTQIVVQTGARTT